ncbi:MAG: TetR/AcrR family transcriptional regulator [Myxococcota bacterium]
MSTDRAVAGRSNVAVLSPRADATRQALLQAATECFAERGFAATTTRAIAARAGVSQPLLNHYFGSKDALFEAIIRDLIEDYAVAQSEQWDRSDDDVAFFTEGLRVMFYWVGSDPLRIRLMTWARLEGRVVVPESAMRLTAIVQQRFVAAQRHGILRADIDLEAALWLADVLFKGYWERRETYTSADAADTADDERFFAMAMRTFIDGLMTPQAGQRARELLAASRGPA